MGTTSKIVYFDKGKVYNKKKLEYFPIELMKYFKPRLTQQISGKGKSQKVDIIEDKENIECTHTCTLTFTIITKDE